MLQVQCRELCTRLTVKLCLSLFRMDCGVWLPMAVCPCEVCMIDEEDGDEEDDGTDPTDDDSVPTGGDAASSGQLPVDVEKK